MDQSEKTAWISADDLASFFVYALWLYFLTFWFFQGVHFIITVMN